VSRRPLVLVLGLTVGNYLLWNWSLDAGHDVLALISGLALTPLAVASLWLLVLNGARLLGRMTRREPPIAQVRRRIRPTAAPEDTASGPAPTTAAPVGSSSRKLAA
jgi:hypothetical protein